VEYDGPWLQLLLVMTFHRAREKGFGDISPLDRDGSIVAIDPIFFLFFRNISIHYKHEYICIHYWTYLNYGCLIKISIICRVAKIGVFKMRKINLVIVASFPLFLITTSVSFAQFGLPSIPGLNSLPIPGLGGGSGGGGGFSMAAESLGNNLRTALYNQVMAISLVQEAQGDKAKAGRLRATANAIQAMKQPNKDTMEKALKAVEENPVNRESVARIKDASGQKKIAEASAHMDVVVVYNGLAVLSAGAMIVFRPSVSDLANAPGILDAAQLAITAIPSQTSNFKKYNEILEAYMAQNNIAQATSAQKVAIAKKTDPEAAKKAKDF
jgi:hypothetical protein